MKNNKYQFKGTPGPWVIVPQVGDTITWDRIENSEGDPICEMTDIRVRKTIKGDEVVTQIHGESERIIADISLIAAGPDLLEACIEVLRFLPEESSLPLKTETQVGNATKKVRAAIHKALNIEAEEA